MALGPFVEYYPTNTETEEFLKYGAPAVVTPVALNAIADVCVLNSHGARSIVVELSATPAGGIDRVAVGIRLSYVSNPADPLTAAQPAPSVIQSLGPELAYGLMGASETYAEQHLAQAAKVDINGVTLVEYYHNFHYVTVYAAGKAIVPVDMLAIPDDQRVVLSVRPVSVGLDSLRVRIAFSDQPLACDIPVIDYADHDRAITSIPSGSVLSVDEDHTLAPGATLARNFNAYGEYCDYTASGFDALSVFIKATQASAVGGLVVTYWVYGTELHTESFTLPAGDWYRAFPRIGGRLPSRVAFTNGAIQNRVHLLVGVSLLGASTPECLIRCPPRGVTPRGEPTATVIDADRVGLDCNVPGVVTAVNTVNATLAAGITVTTGGTASAPTTGKTTALTTDNSTAIATVQVGKRYRVTIIGGEGTCFVNGATAARATDEVWYDKQKFEFIAVATATAAQKYTAGTANSTVNVTPLDGGTIA